MRGCPVIILAVLIPSAPAAEDPDDIAEKLSEGYPHVAEILDAHPEILEVWKEPWWADVLLRGTPLPDSPWRSHDFRRPQPPVVSPDFDECTAVAPPSDVDVLLGSAFRDGLVGEFANRWEFASGVLTTTGRKSNRLASRKSYADFFLHLEFRIPDRRPLGNWQYRGNSGVFLMGKYEIQILDSWNNPVYPDGMLGALYGQRPPSVNASLPPGVWQCMDLQFVAPRFRQEVLIKPARVTAVVNGITVQDDAVFLGPTAFGGPEPYSAHDRFLPFTLQDHGEATSRVSFRNIWAVSAEEQDANTD